MIYEGQKKLEKFLLWKPRRISFIERSLVDAINFTDFYLDYFPENFNLDQDFFSRYLKVFNLKDLSNFHKTKGRVEKTKKEAEMVQEKAKEWYDHYGIKPIDVPVFSNNPRESIKKRADFILEILVCLIGMNNFSYFKNYGFS